jgi:rhodanese-related sulfurtransferase
MIMKKILLLILLFNTVLMAKLENIWVTPAFIQNNPSLTIIDIRTPGEWRETGIVKGSHTIMFFDEEGRFDIPKFLKSLKRVVKKGERFALICRTGSRTTEVSRFLAYELGYNVINLAGGLVKLTEEGYRLTPYRPSIFGW